jgi:hypothetical protein
MTFDEWLETIDPNISYYFTHIRFKDITVEDLLRSAYTTGREAATSFSSSHIGSEDEEPDGA